MMPRLGIAVTCVILLVATGAFWLGEQSRQTTPGAPVQPIFASSPAANADTTGQPPSQDRSDSSSVPLEERAVVTRFVLGWLNRDTRTRRSTLRAVCSPRLAELLAVTDPDKIPHGMPLGPPVEIREDSSATRFSQNLSDGTVIYVDLVPDPTSTTGWTVVTVLPAER